VNLQGGVNDMKTLISFGVAVFVLSFVFSADLVAEEEWEKKLVAEGWVKTDLQGASLSDTTWYAQESSIGDAFNWILYVNSNMENVFFVHIKGDFVWKGNWNRQTDGTYCSEFRGLPGGKKKCGRTLWKNGELYRWVSGDGFPTRAIWAIKKGNTENLHGGS